jgi:peptide chain release factor 2
MMMMMMIYRINPWNISSSSSRCSSSSSSSNIWMVHAWTTTRTRTSKTTTTPTTLGRRRTFILQNDPHHSQYYDYYYDSSNYNNNIISTRTDPLNSRQQQQQQQQQLGGTNALRFPYDTFSLRRRPRLSLPPLPPPQQPSSFSLPRSRTSTLRMNSDCSDGSSSSTSSDSDSRPTDNTHNPTLSSATSLDDTTTTISTITTDVATSSNNNRNNRNQNDNNNHNNNPSQSSSSSSSSPLKLAFISQFIDAKRLLEEVQTLYQQSVQSYPYTKTQLLQQIQDYELQQSQDGFWTTTTTNNNHNNNNHNMEENNSNSNELTMHRTQIQQQMSECVRLLHRLQQWETWYGDAHAAMDMLLESSIMNNNNNNHHQNQKQNAQTKHDMDTATNPSIATDIETSPNHNNNQGKLIAEMTTQQQQYTEEERDLLLDELLSSIRALEKDCRTAELEYLLSGPYDDCPARLTITAGAGGIEAMDWVADLTRMYLRYCDRQFGYSVQKIDWNDSFSGYKSMELLITGPKAYGYLQGEKGSHRLVRISPYNAMGKRQTTFAGVDVTPELPPTLIGTLSDIHIPETELEVTTMRSPGKGGQHVNKVSSGVRMKHIPSGIVVRCTDERSQLSNRNIALHRLKTQLLCIAQEQRVQEIRDIRGDIVEASWGTQIRSYVLHPYRQVKDTRTGWETTQTQAFLDGNEVFEDCIGTYLRYKADKERKESAKAALHT